MLKAMDNSNRLQIVRPLFTNISFLNFFLKNILIFLTLQIDGDTDSPSVQREFEKSIRNHIQNLTGATAANNVGQMAIMPYGGGAAGAHGNQQTDAILQDLENNVPGAVPTISHHVSLMNGHLKNRNTSGHQLANNNNTKGPNTYMNGDIGQTGQTMDFRHMLEEAERYPVDSYM